MKKINLKHPVKKWKSLSKKKKIISSVIAIVLVCVLTAGLVFANRGKGGEMMSSALQEATVSVGTISDTIVGTGNLEVDASDSITVPSGITVKEVCVESGDEVFSGDTLAIVDKASVLLAIKEVQAEIEDLDNEINEYSEETVTETITAGVSGTIKKIYVKKGESVTDCIAKNGALILLAAGGDTDNKLEITAEGGTVSKIHVSKNESVTAGDVLLTIEKDEESVEYQQLIAQRKELAATLKKLSVMAETGAIKADIDGTVGDVNVTTGSSSSGGQSTGTSTTGSDSRSITASQLSVQTGSDSRSTTASQLSVQTGGKNGGSRISAVTLSALSSESGEADSEAFGKTEETLQEKKLTLKILNTGTPDAGSLVLSVPKKGETPQSQISTLDGSYEGKITWTPADKTFAGETTYRAEVVLYAGNGFVFGSDSIVQVQTGILSGTTVTEEGKTLTFSITYPETESEKQTSVSEKTMGETESGKEPETGSGKESAEAQTTGSTGENKGTSVTVSEGTARTGTASSGASSTSTQSSSSGTAESESAYADEITAFTIAPNDSMVLAVNVDELDINSVAEGQEAEITLDAIEDKTFTGTVTKVGNSADASGSGVAKYTVKVTLPKDSQMKAGMNASATIVVENRENVLTIPVNALQEQGEKTFVYTQKDEEGNLSGETEVTTGLSDGENVEITEGLSEGDTVYYRKIGKTSGGLSNEMFGGDRQDRTGGMGEKPDGFSGRGSMGEMPAGGM